MQDQCQSCGLAPVGVVEGAMVVAGICVVLLGVGVDVAMGSAVVYTTRVIQD